MEKKIPTSIRFRADLIDAIEKKARKEEITITEMVESLCEDGLPNYQSDSSRLKSIETQLAQVLRKLR